MHNRKKALLATLALAFSAAVHANDAHIIRLPLTGTLGTPPESATFPDGTQLANTRFYDSPSAALSVGRTDLNGPALPKEVIHYTDMIFVVQGSGTAIDPAGRRRRLKPGDLILLPRGLTIEARDLHQYAHFFASFERQDKATATGPLTARYLSPQALESKDFSDVGGLLKHTYYEGYGGVTVEAVRYPKRVQDRNARQAEDSQLLFVVAGSGWLQEEGSEKVELKPQTAVLIPRSVHYRMSASGLRTVTVRFEGPSVVPGDQQ